MEAVDRSAEAHEIAKAVREVPHAGDKRPTRNTRRSTKGTGGHKTSAALRKVAKRYEKAIAKRGISQSPRGTRAWLIEILHTAIDLGMMDAARSAKRIDPQTARIIDLACAAADPMIQAQMVYFTPRPPKPDPDDPNTPPAQTLGGSLAGAFGAKPEAPPATQPAHVSGDTGASEPTRDGVSAPDDGTQDGTKLQDVE